MSNLTDFIGSSGGGVKSIQSGVWNFTVGTTTTITITPVNKAKSVVNISNTSAYYARDNYSNASVAGGNLTSNTTLRLAAGTGLIGNGAASSSGYCYWQVIEYN